MFSRAIIVVTCILLATAMAKGQAPPRQENSTGFDAATVDKGKDVFGVVCAGCHGANHVTIQRKTSAGWRKTIYTMIGRGAQILPDEIEPLAVYLTAAYGPSSPLPALRGAATDAPQTLPAGGEIVIRSCSGCHSINLILASRKSLSAWKSTIAYMRSNGARVSDTDVEGLAAYLAEHLGAR